MSRILAIVTIISTVLVIMASSLHSDEVNIVDSNCSSMDDFKYCTAKGAFILVMEF